MSRAVTRRVPAPHLCRFVPHTKTVQRQYGANVFPDCDVAQLDDCTFARQNPKRRKLRCAEGFEARAEVYDPLEEAEGEDATEDDV